MRSVPLRGFDQQMAQHIVEDLEKEGVVFVRGAELARVEETEHGRKAATWTIVAGGAAAEASDTFDTVLLAVGRDAYTQKLGLDKAGVTRNAVNGKIPVRREQTNVRACTCSPYTPASHLCCFALLSTKAKCRRLGGAHLCDRRHY